MGQFLSIICCSGHTHSSTGPSCALAHASKTACMERMSGMDSMVPSMTLLEIHDFNCGLLVTGQLGCAWDAGRHCLTLLAAAIRCALSPCMCMNTLGLPQVPMSRLFPLPAHAACFPALVTAAEIFWPSKGAVLLSLAQPAVWFRCHTACQGQAPREACG